MCSSEGFLLLHRSDRQTSRFPYTGEAVFQEIEVILITFITFCTDSAKDVTKDERVSEETAKKGIAAEVFVEVEGADGSQKGHIGDPYDDVYRTLLDDCPQLLIPLVNEIFHEHFTKDDKVVFTKDIHMMKGQEEEPTRRTTDSSFEIIGIVRKKYMIEEQTRPDTSILIRIFEYAMLVARDTGAVEGNVLKVEFPNCAVLFLRSTKNTPDKMQIEAKVPAGVFPIDVFVMKLRNYTLDEMICKDLLFLFPYYLFRFSDYILEKCNQDAEQLEQIKNDYRRMREHLTILADKGELSEFYRHTILYLCKVVVRNLARNYANVVKGVDEIMGGKVIETEAKRILNDGIRKGKIEESVNTERERRRAEAAEQKVSAAEQKISALQKELDMLQQQLQDALRQQGPKLAEQ